jgi:hypothetical protein
MTLIELDRDETAKRPGLIFNIENLDFIEHLGTNHDDTPVYKLHWGVHSRTVSGDQAVKLQAQLQNLITGCFII